MASHASSSSLSPDISMDSWNQYFEFETQKSSFVGSAHPSSIINKLNELKGQGVEITDSDLVESFLPDSYSYKVISIDVIESSSFFCGDLNFDLTVCVNMNSIDEVKTFLSKLN